MTAAPGRIDALVTGRGLPALLSALDLAEVGLRVVVSGGASETLASPERDPEGLIAALLLERIAAPIEGAGSGPDAALLPRRTTPPPPHLVDRGGSWSPQPIPAVLGVPAVPLAAESLRLLGAGGALRAYLDRVSPLLTIGKTASFGELVRKRLGRAVVERSVAPLIRERYGVPAEEVEAAIAAPGLNEALSRTGSLSAAALAYSERSAAREARVEPAGGWAGLAEALSRRLELYGVDFLGEPPRSVARAGTAWAVELGDGRRFETRSLVLDLGREPEVEAAFGLAAELLPDRVRAVSEIEIDVSPAGVGGLPPAAVGVRVVDACALRIDLDAGRAVLSGPATPRSECRRIDPTVAAKALEASGIAPVAGAEWRSEGFRAAPYATVRERDAAADRLIRASIDDPELLPVGRLLHGDDLGAAIASAHERTVALRRELLGLGG
ncbi:hypothetical protein J4H92_12440 [Leucobacter weissii]|uniref:Amine oxidase domain-containing protein n=1 Tax=Leucobacter weissii TaxID=1983706 RepID=A0A939S6U7_9MICO|nr:hypothetical protein [Leucobacter weissii]MBO1902754.1 hypothetical protein [Leucobacter weissii]